MHLFHILSLLNTTMLKDKQFKKRFLQILTITFSIQFVAYSLGYYMYFVQRKSFFLFLFIIGYILSFTIDIYLSTKSNFKKKKKISLILFMPTNYTFLLLFPFAVKLFIDFFEMIHGDLG